MAEECWSQFFHAITPRAASLCAPPPSALLCCPGEVFYQVLQLVRGRASSLEFVTPWPVFLTTTRVGKGEEVVIRSLPFHNRQVEGSVLPHSLSPGSPPTSLPPGSAPLCCLGKKCSVHICSTPGHGHLGKWDSGNLLALIPCCTGCWDIGKQQDTAQWWESMI